MVNVAMEKYNEMREDGSLFSWAESVEFAERAVQANLREQTAEAERLGLEKGFQKGLEQGIEKGIEKGIGKGMEKGLEKGKRALLKSQIAHKYSREDDWIDTLSDHQVEDAVLHILECDTYDALKDRLKGKEVK